MKNITKKVTALALSALFASSQVTFAQAVSNGDTGLGKQNGGAVLGSYEGGYRDMTKGDHSADLNFNGSAHLHWNSLNVDKGENLNFNAVEGATGLTVLNSVTSGMSKFYGNVNANDGIAKLIISNPNGMLFDGAKFTTAGDVMLTTQPMTLDIENGKLSAASDAATKDAAAQKDAKGFLIEIKNNSNLSAGGEFTILAPSINVVQSTLGAAKGLKLITANGAEYLAAAPSVAPESAVRLEAVTINGDVYIKSDKGVVKTVNGGKITGKLDIESDDTVSLNYADGEQHDTLEVTGDVNVTGNGTAMYARNAKFGGNVTMENGGGFLDVGNVTVEKDMNLKTVAKSENPQHYKHFVHVVGNTNVKGDLNIDSKDNIHLGGYNYDAKEHLSGSLTVGGELNAHAKDGHVAVTVNTTANKINLTSDNLNILTDGKAVLTANEYQFKSNGYIGGITNSERFVNTMEHYMYIPDGGMDAGLTVAGGNITLLETKNGNIVSNGDVNIDGVNVKENLQLNAPDKKITLGDNVKAQEITVGKETDTLQVPFTNRDYTLKFTDIRDGVETTLEGAEELTYNSTDGAGGYNQPAGGGERGADTTYLVGPAYVAPQQPPVISVEDNDNAKLLPNADRDLVAKAIDQGEVYTPVAYAADLDEENDKGVRKNVDGSVTVVRAFPMGK